MNKKIPMLPAIIIPIVIVALLSWFSIYTYSSRYEDGYTAGLSDGNEIGYNKGREEVVGNTKYNSCDAAYEAGISAGQSDGEGADYDEGYTTGKSEGYEEGYAAAVEELQSNSASSSAGTNSSPSGTGDSSEQTNSSKDSSTSSTSNSVTVYVTNTGSKYHRAGCRYLSRSKNPISLSTAKSEGYSPCSVCNPPQ